MSGFNNTTRRGDDVSLKLRSQNMRHTREQTKKLEEDSRKMEDRLKELKTAMSREKEERERQGGGFWGRGQTNTGSLTGYASEVLNSKVEKPAKEGKKKKIKVLQDEPIEVPKRSSQPGTVKYIAQRKLTSGSTPRDKQKGPKCGQCEERSATLSCVQCSEIYCAGCFAAFHLKGALKQHRSCPISAVGGRVSMSPRPFVDPSSPRGSQASGSVVSYPKPTYPVDGSEASGPRSSHTTPRQDDGASLLQGDYDESQSAASFQQALKAWRQGDETVSPQQSARKAPVMPRPIASPVKDPVVSMDSSTGTTEETVMPEIKFKGSLSYVEKLMLKKHRRTELGESGTPRLSDQSDSSSRLSNHSDWSSVSRQSHQRERIVNRRDDGVASPLSRRGYRGQDENFQRTPAREQSFIDDGERVDFQSLYQAVVSTEGSVMTTPRSGFSVVDVTDSPPVPSHPAEIDPYDTRRMEGMRSRQDSARSHAPPTSAREFNNNQQSVFPDASFPLAKPSSKYSIEDMYPNQSPPPSEQQQLNQNNYVEEDSWDTFRPTPTPSSFPNDNGDEISSNSNKSLKKKKQQPLQMPSSSPSEENVLSMPSMTTYDNQAVGETSRPKSSKSKSRPSSARPKTASKSRPASRAQSRAASRMMMPEGLLTKTPSKALSEIANLAKNTDDVTATQTALTYQSPLEGFFLAGVDVAALGRQSENTSNEERTITPRKYQQPPQRPKSRSGQAPLKSARGERDAIKVSNRLYQMAPRSWRPDSSLGETIPLDDVKVEDQGDRSLEEDDLVLSYSYSGQMSGRATEWRPSSSQSSIAADNQYEDELNLIQQSSSHHPHNNAQTHGRLHSSQSSRSSSSMKTPTNSSSRMHTPVDSFSRGDSFSQKSITSKSKNRHDLLNYSHQPTPSHQPPSSDDVTTSTSISRRKSANRRSLGASSSSLSNATPTPTPPTPTPGTPQLPSTPKTPTNNKTASRPDSVTPRNAPQSAASLRRSRILNSENESGSRISPTSSSSSVSKSHSTTTATTTKKSQLMGNNLLPSKSEIPFTATRSKSKMAADSSLESSSMLRSNTQTSGIVRSGSNILSRELTRPSSKSSMKSDIAGSLSRRHSNIDQTQHQQRSRPSSSTTAQSASATGQRTQVLNANKGRPVSSTTSQERAGRSHPVTASQSLDMDGRQDSIIADVMSTRVHADGWMMYENGDADIVDDHGDDDQYENDNNYKEDDHHFDSGSRRGVSKKPLVSDSSHWETEVRPFTRESLDSATVRRSDSCHQQQQFDKTERGMSTRPSSTMSGRESRAIVMDGEDLSAYDDAVLDPQEVNEEDNHALEQLEWELASDTGRLTADGQISRLGVFDQDDHSGSSSRSSSSRSLRFCADKDYDLTSKLLEDERLAEQASLSVDLERNGTLDEDEVKALR